MSTNRSVDRFAVTHKNRRSCLCAFTFADGRRCRTPRLNGHPRLCCFHAKREAQSLAVQQVGRDVSSFPLRQLSLRLRSQLGSGPRLLRCRRRPSQT